MSEAAKQAMEAIVKEAGSDPVKAAFLAGMKAERELRSLTGSKPEQETKEEEVHG